MSNKEIDTAIEYLQKSIQYMEFAQALAKNSERKLEEIKTLRISICRLVNGFRDVMSHSNLTPEKTDYYTKLVFDLTKISL